MEIGDIVKAEYKTGLYAGTIVDIAPPRALVEIAAVIKHPQQGDLHHPFEPDVPLFHQRRASAFREKVWVPLAQLEPYSGPIPDYEESLRTALEAEIRLLQRMIRWAERSLAELEALRNDYFRGSAGERNGN